MPLRADVAKEMVDVVGAAYWRGVSGGASGARISEKFSFRIVGFWGSGLAI